MPYVEMMAHLSHRSVSTLCGVKTKSVSDVDVELLYKCYHASFSGGDAQFFIEQTETERREFFDILISDDVPSLALVKDHQIVGFCYVLPYDTYGAENCHMSCMCILPDFRKQRLGTYLLHLSMNAALQHGYQTMTLGTDTEIAAYRLYKRHGFDQIKPPI